MTRLPHPVVGGAFTSPVTPGTGWPDDPAGPDTPVARDADGVRRLAATDDLAELDARVSVCAACPRLVTWPGINSAMTRSATSCSSKR